MQYVYVRIWVKDTCFSYFSLFSCLFVSSFSFLLDLSIMFSLISFFFCFFTFTRCYYLFHKLSNLCCCKRIFFLRCISDNMSRSVNSRLTLRSIWKRARNITLRVNKYFSNKSTQCECIPLFHPFSLFLFSFFIFYLTWHTGETDLFRRRYLLCTEYRGNILPTT